MRGASELLSMRKEHQRVKVHVASTINGDSVPSHCHTLHMMLIVPLLRCPSYMGTAPYDMYINPCDGKVVHAQDGRVMVC